MQSYNFIERRNSRQISVGDVLVGGGALISIQSMTNTITSDVSATVDQVRALEAAGADIVRVSNRFSNVKKVFATTSNPPWSMYKHDTNVNAILELQNGIIVNYIGNWQSNCKSLNFEWRTDCSNGIIIQKTSIKTLQF